MSPVNNGPIYREEAVQLAKQFSCLAEPNRLIILRVITLGGAVGGRMQAMMEATGLSQPTVSSHLRKLLDERFITATTEPSNKRFKVWHIAPDALDEVRELLKSIQGPKRK